jgi:hypothetical protein
MRTALTPGQKTVKLLTKALPEGAEFTEQETIQLGLIRDAVDRIEALKVHLAVELAKPMLSRRGVEISAEVRQLEANVSKLVASLGMDPDAAPVKSVKHQRAANARWSRYA